MKVSVVIPAYNEEKTIGPIIRTVKSVPLVDEIVVVSDGSTDNTAGVALNEGARVIILDENQGKGGAMMTGVNNSKGDIILFLDADLIGLTPEHVVSMIIPILEGKTEVTIGIFEGGRLATDIAQAVAPYLSGQRAMKRELLHNISDLDVTRFGIEIALTKYIKKIGISVMEVELPNMTHVMKEEKLGYIKGFTARLKMYWEIIKHAKKGWTVK